jgi:hypothetical protein
MAGESWLRTYRITFYLALFVTVLVRLYFISGFGPELVGHIGALTGSGRGFDLDLWLVRIGSAAFVLAVASAAAIVVCLGVRAYGTLGEGHQGD